MQAALPMSRKFPNERYVERAPNLNGNHLAASVLNGVPDTAPIAFTRLPTHTMISEFWYNRLKGELKLHLWIIPLVDENAARRSAWEVLVEAFGTRAVKWTEEVELPYPGGRYRSEANPMGAIKGSIYVGLRVPKTNSFRELPQQVRNVIAFVMELDKKTMTRRTI